MDKANIFGPSHLWLDGINVVYLVIVSLFLVWQLSTCMTILSVILLKTVEDYFSDCSYSMFAALVGPGSGDQEKESK